MAMAEKIQDEACRTDALRAVAREWATVDPAAALAAMSARKEKGLKAQLPRDLAEGWARKDPKAAAEYAKSIPDQDRSTKLMALTLVARELAITGLRLLAASKNVVLAAEGYGKHKTISQIVAIISILVLASYNEWGPVGRAIFGFHLVGGVPWANWFTQLAIWVAVALTFISGWLYLWRNRAIYLQDL